MEQPPSVRYVSYLVKLAIQIWHKNWNGKTIVAKMSDKNIGQKYGELKISQ